MLDRIPFIKDWRKRRQTRRNDLMTWAIPSTRPVELRNEKGEPINTVTVAPVVHVGEATVVGQPPSRTEVLRQRRQRFEDSRVFW